MTTEFCTSHTQGAICSDLLSNFSSCILHCLGYITNIPVCCKKSISLPLGEWKERLWQHKTILCATTNHLQRSRDLKKDFPELGHRVYDGGWLESLLIPFGNMILNYHVVMKHKGGER